MLQNTKRKSTITLNYGSMLDTVENDIFLELDKSDTYFALCDMRKRSNFICLDDCLTKEYDVASEEGFVRKSKLYTDTLGFTRKQVLEYMKLLLKKYDTVVVYDMYCLGTVTLHASDESKYHYEDLEYGDINLILSAYGEEVIDDQPPVPSEQEIDLEKEKWDNYYGDFNQCGIRIDYN